MIEQGRHFDEARDEALRLACSRVLHVVPSFLPELVRGVATYALELFQAVAHTDTLLRGDCFGFGICEAIHVRDQFALRAEIVGVGWNRSDAYAQSFEQGHLIATASVDAMADGIACRTSFPRDARNYPPGIARSFECPVKKSRPPSVHCMKARITVSDAGAVSLAALPQEQGTQRGGETAGRETVEQLTRIFGCESVYVEVQRHQEREEEWRNQAAIRIARSLRLPIVATNGVRYATAYDAEIQDLFTAIRNHVELDQAGRILSVNNQRHLRTARQMAALFRDVPGAVENTVSLSSRLGFQLNDLGYRFPPYQVPDGETMDSFLRKRVMEGVEQRYGLKSERNLIEKAKKQVERELALIAKLGFAGYFLIVRDIIRF